MVRATLAALPILAVVLLSGCVPIRQKPLSRYPVGTAALMLTPEEKLKLQAGENIPIENAQVCQYERVTGSQIAEWRCRYLSQREMEEFGARKLLLQSVGTSTSGAERLKGGGGT